MKVPFCFYTFVNLLYFTQSMCQHAIMTLVYVFYMLDAYIAKYDNLDSIIQGHQMIV